MITLKAEAVVEHEQDTDPSTNHMLQDYVLSNLCSTVGTKHIVDMSSLDK